MFVLLRAGGHRCKYHVSVRFHAPITDLTKPFLLDLYCGAGGAAMGYSRFFNIIGVDYLYQRHYPFKFHMMKATDFLLSTYFIQYNFVAIHASPPCQLHSKMTQCRGVTHQSEHRDHISEIRPYLQATGLPFIIENVDGAPLINPIKICGASIPTIHTIRHRYFESNVPSLWGIDCPPQHPLTRQTLKDTKVVGVNVKGSLKHHIAEGLGIDWMTVREMQQAIPPAYTEHLGKQLYELLF